MKLLKFNMRHFIKINSFFHKMPR
ncbi:MAG TPA: hypothetical protein DD405_05840 [Desulfobacteraceae bacterium]|nr:hypothetical protein [Desulfobacteraceae bacterium]